MNQADLLETCQYGIYYFPAWKHYNNPNANVICDQCRKESLVASIGHKHFDLCLLCADNFLSKPSNKKGGYGYEYGWNPPIKSDNIYINGITLESPNQIRQYLHQWDHLGNDSIKQIYNEVIGIIRSVEFQKDKSGYLKNWIKRRGSTQELRIPEDPALEIITQLIDNHIIKKSI